MSSRMTRVLTRREGPGRSPSQSPTRARPGPAPARKPFRWCSVRSGRLRISC